MDGVLTGWWSLTPVGLFLGGLALVFWLLSSGKLYTSRQHDEVVGFWKAAATTAQETNKELTEQNTLLIQQAQIVSKFFEEADRTKAGGTDVP